MSEKKTPRRVAEAEATTAKTTGAAMTGTARTGGKMTDVEMTDVEIAGVEIAGGKTTGGKTTGGKVTGGKMTSARTKATGKLTQMAKPPAASVVDGVVEDEVATANKMMARPKAQPTVTRVKVVIAQPVVPLRSKGRRPARIPSASANRGETGDGAGNPPKPGSRAMSMSSRATAIGAAKSKSLNP